MVLIEYKREEQRNQISRMWNWGEWSGDVVDVRQVADIGHGVIEPGMQVGIHPVGVCFIASQVDGSGLVGLVPRAEGVQRLDVKPVRRAYIDDIQWVGQAQVCFFGDGLEHVQVEQVLLVITDGGRLFQPGQVMDVGHFLG